MSQTADPEVLAALATFDTPSVSTAIRGPGGRRRVAIPSRAWGQVCGLHGHRPAGEETEVPA